MLNAIRGSDVRYRVVIAAVALIAACGGDAVTPETPDAPEENLTAAEAEVFLTVVMPSLMALGNIGWGTVSFGWSPSHDEMPRGLPATRRDRTISEPSADTTFSVNTSLPCLGGGLLEWDFAITLDVQSGGLQYASDGATTVTNCIYPWPNGGSITLNGNTSEQWAFDGVTTNGVITINGSTRGRLRWELGQRSAVCEIDLSYRTETSTNSTVPSTLFQMTGSVCGHSVDHDVSLG